MHGAVYEKTTYKQLTDRNLNPNALLGGKECIWDAHTRTYWVKLYDIPPNDSYVISSKPITPYLHPQPQIIVSTVHAGGPPIQKPVPPKPPTIIAEGGAKTIKKFGWEDSKATVEAIKHPEAGFYLILEDVDGNEVAVPVDMSCARIVWSPGFGKQVNEIKLKAKVLEVETPYGPALPITGEMNVTVALSDVKRPKPTYSSQDDW